MAPIAGHGKAFVEDGKLIGFLVDGEYLWHTDMSYVEVPPKASCLYSIEVPDAEGDAGFPNMPVTYNPLPYDVKRRIEGLTINHDTRYTIV